MATPCLVSLLATFEAKTGAVFTRAAAGYVAELHALEASHGLRFAPDTADDPTDSDLAFLGEFLCLIGMKFYGCRLGATV